MVYAHFADVVQHPRMACSRSRAMQWFTVVHQERNHCDEKTTYSVSERREPGPACATTHRLSFDDPGCFRAHALRSSLTRPSMMLSPACDRRVLHVNAQSIGI